MEENTQKEKIIAAIFVLCGLFSATIGSVWLLLDGINRMSLHLIGGAFFFWAFAATPGIGFLKAFENIKFTKASKILFGIGTVILLLSLAVHFWIKP